MITDNPILTGIICVAGSEAMTAITSAGGRAVRSADSDRNCRDPGHPFAIAVPEGLEGWTIEILTKLGYRAAQTETRECKVMAPTKVLSSPGGRVLGQLSEGTFLYTNKEAQVSGSNWSYVLEPSIEGWVRGEDLECNLAKWWYGTDETELRRDVMPGPGKSIAIAFCHIEGDPVVGIGNSPTETMSAAITKCIAATPTRATCCKVVVAGDSDNPCVALTMGEHTSYGVGTGKTGAAAEKKAVDDLDQGPSRNKSDVLQCLPGTSDALGGAGWNHNGSTMTLRVVGDTVEIFYDSPKTGMTKAGAKPGDLLFTGKRNGQNISGTAWVFSNCGKTPYDVAGRIKSTSHITMRGQAPRLDDRCQTTGHRDDLLEFAR